MERVVWSRYIRHYVLGYCLYTDEPTNMYTMLTVRIYFLNNLFHLCLCGVEIESTENISHLVRVNLPVSPLVKQREGITVL